MAVYAYVGLCRAMYGSSQAINILLDTRCYIIAFVIIEAVMAAQSSFEFSSVVGGGGGVRRYFSHNRGGVRTIFFLFWRGGTV